MMNVHVVLKMYTDTINYYKGAIAEVIMCEYGNVADRSAIGKMFDAFIAMADPVDLMVGFKKKIPPKNVMEKVIDQHKSEWDAMTEQYLN